MHRKEPGWRPFAVAVGLVVAGITALIVASWVLDGDLADVGPGRGWIQAFTIVLLVGVATTGVLRHRPIAALTWTLAVVALGLTVLAAIGFIAQYETGFPGAGTLLAAVGGLAVAVGTLLTLPVPAGRWRLPPVGSGLSSACALLVVAVFATPLTLTAPEWRLTATTAAAAEPAPVPAEVTRVAWSTEVDGPIKTVVAAGMGAVVLLDDGVVAVDGTTGEIRWSHRRAGAKARQLDASPDGRTVLLQTSPQDRFPIRTEVLDAFTGDLRFVDDSPNTSHSPGFITPVTNGTYIKANHDVTDFSGHSLIDGRELWRFRAPDGCEIAGTSSKRFARGTGFLLGLTCGQSQFRFVSVDAVTGTLRWQHEWQLSSSGVDLTIDRGTDSDAIQIYVHGGLPDSRVVLDADTGNVLPTPTPLDVRSRGFGVTGDPKGDRSLIDIRGNRVLSTQRDVVNCALDAFTILSAEALCLDQSADLPAGRFLESGTTPLTVARFDGTAHRLDVPLGGPFLNETSHAGHEMFVSKAVAGAVVAYSDFQPAGGHRARVVGLR
jgi:outer membrane protein assembly factor BamB